MTTKRNEILLAIIWAAAQISQIEEPLDDTEIRTLVRINRDLDDIVAWHPPNE
jgi:hypothetical protein